MNVFLIGGGWSDELAPEIYGGFIEAAAAASPGITPSEFSTVFSRPCWSSHAKLGALIYESTPATIHAGISGS